MTGHGTRPPNVSVLFRGCGFEICKWLLAESIPPKKLTYPRSGSKSKGPNCRNWDMLAVFGSMVPKKVALHSPGNPGKRRYRVDMLIPETVARDMFVPESVYPFHAFRVTTCNPSYLALFDVRVALSCLNPMYSTLDLRTISCSRTTTRMCIGDQSSKKPNKPKLTSPSIEMKTAVNSSKLSLP